MDLVDYIFYGYLVGTAVTAFIIKRQVGGIKEPIPLTLFIVLSLLWPLFWILLGAAQIYFKLRGRE